MVAPMTSLPAAVRPLEARKSDTPGMGRLIRMAMSATPRVSGMVCIIPPEIA